MTIGNIDIERFVDDICVGIERKWRRHLGEELYKLDQSKFEDWWVAEWELLESEESRARPDIDMVMTGQPKTRRDRAWRVLEIVEELEEDLEGAVSISKVKSIADDERINGSFVEDIINSEMEKARLYEPRKGEIRRTYR